MKTYIKSEALKMKHTFSEKICWLMPVLTLLLSAVLMWGYFAVNSYNWWYGTMLPGMTAIICGLAGQKDKKMKNQAVASLPISLKKVWEAKIVICCKGIVIGCMVVFLGEYILVFLAQRLFHMQFSITVTLTQGLAATLILIVTTVWQVPFYLCLNQIIGFFPTVLMGFGLSAVIGILSAVESFWYLVPFAIPARLMCPILGVLPNGLPAQPGNMTFTPELLSESVILPGICISVLWFLVLGKITSAWHEKQIIT